MIGCRLDRRPTALGTRLLPAAELPYYTREVAHCLIKVVVDHDTGRDLESLGFLTSPELHATLNVLLRVAPGSKPLLLDDAEKGRG